MSSSGSPHPRALQTEPKRGRGRPRLRREIRIESHRRSSLDFRKLTRVLIGAAQAEALAALAAASRHRPEPEEAPVRPHVAHTGAAPPPSARPGQRAPSAPHTGADGHDG